MRTYTEVMASLILKGVTGDKAKEAMVGIVEKLSDARCGRCSRRDITTKGQASAREKKSGCKGIAKDYILAKLAENGLSAKTSEQPKHRAVYHHPPKREASINLGAIDKILFDYAASTPANQTASTEGVERAVSPAVAARDGGRDKPGPRRAKFGPRA